MPPLLINCNNIFTTRSVQTEFPVSWNKKICSCMKKFHTDWLSLFFFGRSSHWLILIIFLINFLQVWNWMTDTSMAGRKIVKYVWISKLNIIFASQGFIIHFASLQHYRRAEWIVDPWLAKMIKHQSSWYMYLCFLFNYTKVKKYFFTIHTNNFLHYDNSCI